MDETTKLKKDLQQAQTRLKRVEDVIFGFKDDPVFKAKIQKASNESGGSDSRFLSVPTPEAVTISSGAISISQSYHTVSTEGGAASDDLTDISDDRSNVHEILVLRAASSSETVVLKDGIGNGVVWYEVARSNNGA